jgi:organic hydroperoxide reductase OsmC/OhrA
LRTDVVVIELVWDADRTGTATAPTGAVLKVGEGVAWSPENLLALSAATCLMRTFLRMAADEHVDVLGYVAAASLEPGIPLAQAVRVRSCVVVPTGVPTSRVLDLCCRATTASPVATTLGDRLRHVPEISRIDGRLEV